MWMGPGRVRLRSRHAERATSVVTGPQPGAPAVTELEEVGRTLPGASEGVQPCDTCTPDSGLQMGEEMCFKLPSFGLCCYSSHGPLTQALPRLHRH